MVVQNEKIRVPPTESLTEEKKRLPQQKQKMDVSGANIHFVSQILGGNIHFLLSPESFCSASSSILKEFPEHLKSPKSRTLTSVWCILY